MPYVRTVRTSSGATAVQIVWKYRRGSREIEHLGSAHSEVDVELLKAAAVQRIAAGQDELPLGTPTKTEPAALEITSTRMGRLLDAVGYAYQQLGLDVAAGRDQVFEQLVTARIIEPTSKEDAVVIKHRNRAASSACGAANVLEALGVVLDLAPEAQQQVVDQVGIGFLLCLLPPRAEARRADVTGAWHSHDLQLPRAARQSCSTDISGSGGGRSSMAS